jgi:uroporphyrinogen-III synthase
LIVRGEGGREELADGLRKQGVEVEYLEVYQRIMPDIDTAPVISLLKDNRLDCITITSGEALQNLMALLGKDCHRNLLAIPLIVVSGRIKSMAEHMGFKRIAVTNSPSDTAILETITTLINGE